MSTAPTVQTVTGPVPAADLGVTLCHEHLFNDLSGVVDPPSFPFSDALVGQRVRPELMWALRQDPYCCADNMADKPVASVIAEVEAFAALGGRTIVDATGSAAIGRAPQRLRTVAEATSLNIVMSTGPYLEKFEAEQVTSWSVDQRVARIHRELNVGVEDTGIRAGMIGEVGVSPRFTAGERSALRAAGIAQTMNPTVALNVHLPGWQRRGDAVLDILIDDCGVSPAKISLAHCDPSGEDLDYQRRLLDRGVWLEFDMIGLDITFPGEGASPSVPQTVAAVSRLVEHGYADQLLLSHDLFLKQMWTQNGGNGFAFVPQVFLALLEQAGVPAPTCQQLVTANPARVLTA